MEYGIKYVVGEDLRAVTNDLALKKDHYTLLFIKEHGCSLFLNQNLIDFPPNSLIFVPFGTQLKSNPDENREFVLIYFTEAFFSRSEWDGTFLQNFFRVLQDSSTYRMLSVPDDYLFYYQFVRAHLEMARKQPPESIQHVLAFNIIKQILLLGAVYIGDRDSAQLMDESEAVQVVNRFQQLIAENVNHEKHVGYYADHLRISPRKLSLYTKDVMNKTPKELITDGLIRVSKRLLANSKLSIKQIAWQLGYVDENNFSTLFSKEAGISPKKYRSDWKK
ncbi:AraC-type DNA-binding protein [Sphingobacterium nematocida]|uniref:AraC-type DNA-binding protein n=1 Tax=Sphingobacterium nematocida TaxID=1513896 RepID=A0A1T5G490_9SPHI|nr:helix-turn-helix transcriptional regulator [Sphingobacterium nematocida]SKC03250.1 AraC-type DNA-binding protein [Sphingobacterium nematocida]